MSDVKNKLKKELKVWIYYQIIKSNEENNLQMTYEDVNSALIDILHDNNQHDPKKPFKKK
jgi:hypothetical protein